MERNYRIFRGVESSSKKVWSLARFYVALWATVPKVFCSYSFGLIWLDWSPLLF